MQKHFHLLAITLLCALPYLPAQAQPKNTYETTLKNGLKVIVREDHRAPIVVSQVWYKVGSSYEYEGVTGLSHMLEHMMFKGTKKYGPNEFSKIISENGGRENAFTGRDYTAYFQQLEKSRLHISLKLEADRMRNLTLPNDEFIKENKVVIEERRLRTEDKPQSLTYEQFNAAAFVTSPYHHPVIGWMNDLENMDINDLKDWYKQWYAPNNATLVVVGDVKANAVFKLAKKYFGRLKPSKQLTSPKPRLEIEQKGTRRIAVKAPAELPYLLMGYKVPVLRTAKDAWEPYALDVLANVLDGGASARFAKNLVRKQQIATSVGAGYNLSSRNSDLFLFDGTPSKDHTTAELEQAIVDQIKQVQTKLVDEDELNIIKAQVVAGNIYEKDSVFYQAMQIGTLETVGLKWQLLDDYVKHIKAVTAEQVQKVAVKYLVPDHLTVAELDPQPIDHNKARRPHGPTGRH